MTTDNFRKHTSKNPLQRSLINRFYVALLEELRALTPDTILDVGCGEGFTLERLRTSTIGNLLEGVDVQPGAVELGKKLHPELTLRVGTVYALPYQDGAFHTVLCSEVLEHLDAPARALEELRRVTARYCVITVPHEPFFRLANFLRGKNMSRWGNDIEHIQHWSAHGITELVGKYFTVHAVRTPFPWIIVVGEKK